MINKKLKIVMEAKKIANGFPVMLSYFTVSFQLFADITAGTMQITAGTTSTLSEDPFSSLRFCFYMRHAGIYNMLLRCFSTKVASTEGTPSFV